MNKTSKPVRVLQIAGGFRKDENGKALSGGIVAFLHNYCMLVDEKQIHFDYLAIKNQCFEDHRADFEKKGSKLYCLNIQSDGFRRAFSVIKELRAFLKTHKYDAVHINIGSFFPVLCCAIAAKLAGVKNIITHSHSAGIYSKKKRFFTKRFQPLLPLFATKLCSCSKIAALNLYPEKMVQAGKVQIIRNAVDVNKYKYDCDVRKDMRARLGIKDEPVIGHVGRFVEVKNHSYLIDTFFMLKKLVPNSKLLLVGDGELLPSMQGKVKKLGLVDDVIFAGRQMNVSQYYQVMDIFVLPSTVEGLGIVAIEAQTTGMPCLISSVVPQEVYVTDLCHAFRLEDGKEAFAQKICEELANLGLRKDRSCEICDAGYHIKENIMIFQDLYLKPNS